MNEYYNKKTYLELVKKQTEVYKKFVDTIDWRDCPKTANVSEQSGSMLSMRN